MSQSRLPLSIISALSLGLLVTVSPLAAQTEAPVPSGPFYAVGSNGALTPLPEVKARLRGEGKLFYVRGSRVAYVISGKKAPLRLKESDPQIFIGADRPGPVLLVKLKGIHDKREWVVNEATSFFPPLAVYSSFRNDTLGVPRNLTLKDSHELQLEPKVPLSPGEYAIADLGGLQTNPPDLNREYLWYSFGIDAPATPSPTAASQSRQGVAQVQSGTSCILLWCRSK
jgi:hypothetical protein